MTEVLLLYADLVTSGIDAFAELLRTLEKHGYAPDDFGKPKSMKGTIDDARKQIARRELSVVVARNASPAVPSFSVQSSDEANDNGTGTIVSVSLTPTKSTPDLILALASWGRVLQGAGHDEYELAHIDTTQWPAPGEPIELRGIFQYTVLGKELVATLGKKRVMSTPGVKIHELPNGGVLIDAGTEAAGHAKAFAHLCPDQPVPERKIPRRVKPDWDPEMAPVFATLVEREAIEDRNAFITKLNKLKPAKPETASPPRGANLPDQKKAIGQYRSVADELVVLLHDKEPALGSNAGPEVLPLLDAHFYTEDYPGSFGAEKTALLLRPLGAWLGELLVRELDGEWAPRGKMDEVEVVVGKTAFLPLLRAKHYLASKEAVLEYSLTKYFSDAKKLAKKK